MVLCCRTLPCRGAALGCTRVSKCTPSCTAGGHRASGLVRRGRYGRHLLAQTLITLAVFIYAFSSPSGAGAVICNETATYDVTFQFNWSPGTDTGYPSDSSSGFSRVICALHSTNFTMWAFNEVVSPAVQQVAEIGDETSLIAVLQEAEANGTVAAWFQVPALAPPSEDEPNGDITDLDEAARQGINPPIGSIDEVTFNTTVDGTTEETVLSCITSILPSPDFFVGIQQFDFCNRTTGVFNESVNFLLPAYDAGTDNGQSYVAENDPVPPDDGNEPVRFLVGFADSYGGAFLVRTDLIAEEPVGEDVSSPLGSAENSEQVEETASCFPATERLTLTDGTTAAMHEISVGYRAALPVSRASVNSPGAFGSDPSMRWSDIYFFSHSDADRLSTFVRIEAGNDQTSIRLSPGHYIYLYRAADLAKQALEASNGLERSIHWETDATRPRMHLVAADTVVVGDALVSGEDDAAPLLVTRVSRVVARGLYNPHTSAGIAVVSGVRVSCYTRAVVPRVAHALLRVGYGVRGLLVGALRNTPLSPEMRRLTAVVMVPHGVVRRFARLGRWAADFLAPVIGGSNVYAPGALGRGEL